MITGDNTTNAGGSEDTLKMNLSNLHLESSYFVQPLFRVERDYSHVKKI
jgi:hypothetical protein